MKVWLATIILVLLTGCVNAETKSATINIDKCELLQLTINSLKLQSYFHIKNKPERKPLKLLFLDEKLMCQSLKKFDENVIFIKKENNNIPYIKIHKINFNNDIATIEFEYKVEGIKGIATFKREQKKWIIVSEKIVEI